MIGRGIVRVGKSAADHDRGEKRREGWSKQVLAREERKVGLRESRCGHLERKHKCGKDCENWGAVEGEARGRSGITGFVARVVLCVLRSVGTTKAVDFVT
jgi:hypothetical protein